MLQQECRTRDGQRSTGTGNRRSVRPRGGKEWVPQSQGIAGRVSAGTNMAASHTRSFAVILSQNRKINVGLVSSGDRAAAGLDLPAWCHIRFDLRIILRVKSTVFAR